MRRPLIFSRPTLTKSEVTRQRLLEAAVEIFGQRGLEGATVREIARASGQNVAAIAYHFGSKERLYAAVLEEAVREIRHRLNDVLADMTRLREQPAPSRAQATAVLQRFLRAIYTRFLSQKEAVALGRLIVREQMQPTGAFDLIYEQGFRTIHEGLCWLLGVILNEDAQAARTIIRTHSLMGQVYFFAMSRETVRRRLRWKELDGRNAEFVADVIEENVDLLLGGLAARPEKKRR